MEGTIEETRAPAITAAKVEDYLTLMGWREDNNGFWQHDDYGDVPLTRTPDTGDSEAINALIDTLAEVEGRTALAVHTDIQDIDLDVIRIVMKQPEPELEHHISLSDGLQVLSSIKGMVYAYAEDKFEGIGKAQVLELFQMARTESDGYVFVIPVQETDYDNDLDRDFLVGMISRLQELVNFVSPDSVESGSDALAGVSRKFINAVRRLSRTCAKGGSITVDVRWSPRTRQQDVDTSPIMIDRAVDKALKEIMDELDEIPLKLEFVGLITRFVRDLEGGDYVQVSLANVMEFEGEDDAPETIRIDLDAGQYDFAEEAFVNESAVHFLGSVNRSGLSYKVDEMEAFELSGG